jgi:hypothetical protein
MRKASSLLAVVFVLGISTSVAAAPRRDASGDFVQRIVIAVKRAVVHALDLAEVGVPKP